MAFILGLVSRGLLQLPSISSKLKILSLDLEYQWYLFFMEVFL